MIQEKDMQAPREEMEQMFNRQYSQCKELKEHKDYADIMSEWFMGKKFYVASDVDAAIAELNQKLDKTIAERDWNQVCIDALKQKLEDAKATAYAESVDSGMENRKLKRALWLARAERANESHFMWCQFIYDKKFGIVKFNVRKEWGENVKQGQTLHTPQGWADVWEEVERKCRAKAESYL